jgi:hypothetical protein
LILAETPKGVLLVVSSWLQSPICDHVSLILYAEFHCSNNLSMNHCWLKHFNCYRILLCVESYVFMCLPYLDLFANFFLFVFMSPNWLPFYLLNFTAPVAAVGGISHSTMLRS